MNTVVALTQINPNQVVRACLRCDLDGCLSFAVCKLWIWLIHLACTVC